MSAPPLIPWARRHIVADASKPWSRPTGVALFARSGDGAQALRQTGHHVVAHETNQEALTYLVNELGFDVVADDPQDLDFRAALYDDARTVVGTPAWWRDPAADELPTAVRAIAQIRPKTFILVLPRGLAAPKHREILEERVAELALAGYFVEHRVLDSADHGCGESRRRLVIIGVRLDVVTERAKDPYEWRDLHRAINWPGRLRPHLTGDSSLTPMFKRLLVANR